MTDTRKPCPFCASRRNTVEHLGSHARPFYVVACMNCEAEGPIELTSEAAVTAWNTRALRDGVKT